MTFMLQKNKFTKFITLCIDDNIIATNFVGKFNELKAKQLVK